MGQTAGAKALPVERGGGRCKRNLMATVEILFEVADGLVTGTPGLGIRENGPSILCLPVLFKVFLLLAFETEISRPASVRLMLK